MSRDMSLFCIFLQKKNKTNLAKKFIKSKFDEGNLTKKKVVTARGELNIDCPTSVHYKVKKNIFSGKLSIIKMPTITENNNFLSQPTELSKDL